MKKDSKKKTTAKRKLVKPVKTVKPEKRKTLAKTAGGRACKLLDRKTAKDASDRLPTVRNATDVQRVRLPKIDVRKVKKCSCATTRKAKRPGTRK